MTHDDALASLIAARANLPDRAEFQAYFDAALDTLRKGAPGLGEPVKVALARSIAMKCQAARKALPVMIRPLPLDVRRAPAPNPGRGQID